MKFIIFALVLFSAILLTPPSEAKKWPKIGIGGMGPKGGMKCNMFSWSTSSWSTTTDSCDYIVPMAKVQEEEIHRFVEINQERLMEDMSQGRGQIISDYATLLGCSEDAREVFNKTSQENFDKIFNGVEDSTEILKRTRENMQKNSILREKCRARS